MHPHHHGPLPRSSIVVQRRLTVAVLPFVIATLIGLLALWPDASVQSGDVSGGAAAARFEGEVVNVDRGGCEVPPTNPNFVCSVVEIRVVSGPDSGTTFESNELQAPEARKLAVGDDVIVSRQAPIDELGSAEPVYSFVDYQRSRPLVVLAALFAIVVVGLSRWRGLMSLAGVALSFAILIWFVIPAIIEGSNPLMVAIIGSAAVMFVALYLAHGVNVRTTSAVLGTLASLAVTGILAVIFVELSRFTGLSSEDAAFLQVYAEHINFEGLLLGGVIIGTLGVLDDVTVTQASAVWELHIAQPEYRAADLYRAAVRIGRDHIASTVNTLVLAYAGAALPLLILFTLSSRPLGEVLTTEVIAEEIVRTLVGSIGLVAAVPITTGLTALVVSGSPRSRPVPGRPKPRRPPPQDEAPAGEHDEDLRDSRSRFEREWFGSRSDFDFGAPDE